MEVSSAKSLAFDEIPLDKSFMQIKKNKSPNIEPYGTLASTVPKSKTDYLIELVDVCYELKFVIT